MDVVSLSPLRVASIAWQPRRGSWVLTVVCKATYKLLPGRSRLSESQEYPNDDDNHWNDDPDRSLYSPSDLCPFKQRADVMLVGHAFAPYAEPARSLYARLAVGTVDKSIEVFGDRAFLPDGSLREPTRFIKMPLRYERAWGGPDTWNPVGMHGAVADANGLVAVPNLQRRGDLVRSPTAALEPVGFGPIAASWPERARALGHVTLGRGWSQEPLPEGIDPRYFNAAPSDQQVDMLADDALILLEHLHPEHPHLITSLPGIHPRAFVERSRAGAAEELELSCDTLWIDTDRSIATLTWRGQVPVDGPNAPGRVLVAMETPDEQVTWAEVLELAEVDLAEDEDGASEEPPDIAAHGVDSGTQTNLTIVAVRGSDAPPASAPPLAGSTPVRTLTPPPGSTPASDALAKSLRLELPAKPDSVGAQTRPPLFTATQDEAVNVFAIPHVTEGLRDALPFVRPAVEDPRTTIDTSLPDATPPWLQRKAAPPVDPAPTVLPFAPPAPTPPAPPSVVAPPRTPATQRPAGLRAPTPPAAPPSEATAPSFTAASLQGAKVPAPLAPLAPEVVELLWFEPSVLARMRSDARFRPLVTAVRAPTDPAEDADATADAGDRRDVFAVLTRASALDAEGVNGAIAGAIGPDGEFVAPLVAVMGDLLLPFDEVSALKATMAALTPLASSEPALREPCAAAAKLLASPWLEGAGSIAEGYNLRLKEAFARVSTGLPPTYLSAGTERLLLEQRAFQRRTVLGESHLRGLLTLTGSDVPLPVYLPELLAKRLPLFCTMRVRLLAEVHVQQDAAEAHPNALRGLALGRVLPVGRR